MILREPRVVLDEWPGPDPDHGYLWKTSRADNGAEVFVIGHLCISSRFERYVLYAENGAPYEFAPGDRSQVLPLRPPHREGEP
jgi:hypothetical protein